MLDEATSSVDTQTEQKLQAIRQVLSDLQKAADASGDAQVQTMVNVLTGIVG